MKEPLFPPGVLQVALILYSKQPVGRETYKICQEIIKKYPEYFPWESKYNSIPQHVHDSFSEQAYGRKKSFIELYAEFNNDANIKFGGGIKQFIDNQPTKTVSLNSFTQSDFDNFIQNIENNHKNKMKEDQRVSKIWDKHYKKYNSPYRP